MTIDFKEALTRADLIGLFAPAVGQEKSAETVDAAVGALHLPPEPWGAAEALQIVQRIARSGGLIGIVARLAAARLQAKQAFEVASRK
ncbi:MAG: hypothetical protein IRZ16_21950 [Myxococcaceae bacterium]|nr:hypothetical protein [Myxococcaceae bacterium]